MDELFWRVESKENGYGPYFNGANTKVPALYMHNNWITHPNPAWEGYTDIKSDEVCAFETLDQLYSWFSQDILQDLGTIGYRIAAYVGELMFKGEKQAVIKKHKLVKEIEL